MDQVQFDFSDNRYVVTGASSGMGRQVAAELAAAHAQVLALARRQEPLEELRQEYPDNIHPAVVDVCDAAALEAAIQQFTAQYGKLHGSVHAAGIGGFTPLKVYDKAYARKMMDTTFWAGMDLLQLVTKNKYGERGSAHVLFSSADALYCGKGKFAYSAAKAAVNSAVRAAAKELCAKGNRVNAVMPGWVDTPMTAGVEGAVDPMGVAANELLGIGKPADVSGMVLFLLSSRSTWITGTAVSVDGGFLA